MYYRVAIRVNAAPTWQWKSTVLSSLNTLFQGFQFYQALPQDRLRVFSSSSRDEINEHLMCENQGLGSNSVPAVQFLRERLIYVREMTAEASAHGAREQGEPATVGSATKRSCNECSPGAHALAEKGLPVLERKRGETEWGAGSDHDLPYIFTLPSSWPQVRAWMRLLARVHSGELQP
jgi:hypothetical protein